MQPLPRSLDPLPEESLPGYLLRLAHRLGVAPSRLATRLGLTAGRGHCSPGSLLHLPDPARDVITVATRLTHAEVDDLCLNSLGSRYPLPAPAPKSRTPARSTHSDRWVLAPATRYCPRCLAGDGSEIQRAHGGPWRKIWHLPVVFLCTQHQQLMEDRCPNCSGAVHAGRPGSPAQLLPSMSTPALHPAQCRTILTSGSGRRVPACCGTRLDAAWSGPSPLIGKTLIDLQHRLLRLLRTDVPEAVTSAGRSSTAVGYFTDLRILALLICSSWPATRHSAPSTALAEAIDHHVERQQRAATELRKRSPTSWRLPTLDAPPHDSAASAGLLSIADHITALHSPGEVRECLRLLLPPSTRQTRRTAWGDLFQRPGIACSDGLREACGPLLRGFTRADGRPSGRREAILQPACFGPEHIPAFLPKDWYDKHFSHFEGINTKILRRTAAVRLVQMIAGGSMGDAAEFLGINPDKTQYTSASDVHSWARAQADPSGFQTALHSLTAELDTTPRKVNYQQRREWLRDWALPGEAWQILTSRLPPIPGHIQPGLGDLKRQLASIYVWVRLTQGEHLFAPRPIEAIQFPELQNAWKLRRNTIWHHFQTSRPLRHYADLKRLLDEYGDQLAGQISSAAHPGPAKQPEHQVTRFRHL